MIAETRRAISRRGPGGRRQGHKGQALVIFGLMFIFLIGIVGLATDGAVAYAYSVSLERAASAAALAGAPYMPNYLGTATTRAQDEAKRNGWVDGSGTTSVVVSPSGSRELDVKVSTVVPTFFMAALGIKPYRVTREAIAGYLPPIPLGQPGNQLGSTGAQLGGGNNFYLLRVKAENKFRSEGDPYGTQATEGQSPNSLDVHNISAQQGNEVPSLDCSAGTWKLPCKGGQNFRVTVPSGTTGELQVYNAAFAPDFNTNNKCDNFQGLPATVNGNTTCGPYTMREGTDDGMGGTDPNTAAPPSPAKLGEPLGNAHCGNTINVDCQSGAGGTANRARRKLYNAVSYTLMAVPNIFVRSDDLPIMQTRILPIDATNYDGKDGTIGSGSGFTPKYVNVNDGRGLDITQTYVGGVGPCALCPKNMRVYHSWDNIVTEDGNTNGDNRDSAGQNIITGYVTDATNYPKYIGLNGSLKEGTYRLRVDLLNSDGSCCGAAAEGDASKGYALRVVTPGLAPYLPSAGNQCVSGGINCEIAGWEDMTVYSPIAGLGGSIPLFSLPQEYKGQTILVDAYDVGDAPGQVNLSLTDPKTGTIATCGAGSVNLPTAVATGAPVPANSCQQYTGSPAAAPVLNIYNQGHDRFSLTPLQHIGPQFPSGALPTTPDNRITHAPFTQVQAGEQSTTGGTGNYNGEWIRFEIPIAANYNGNCSLLPLPAFAPCYWQLQYTLTAGANDTFSFAVSTKGGPLHLISS